MLSGSCCCSRACCSGWWAWRWIETRRGQPGADAPRPLDVAVMLAARWACTVSRRACRWDSRWPPRSPGPGGLVVLGVALHSLVDGAAVAAPVVGQPMPAGARVPARGDRRWPEPARHHRGHRPGWDPGSSCSCSRVAAGTLIYVLRELLRARLEDVGAVGAMWALVVGMLLGLGCGAGDRARTVTAGCGSCPA